MKPIRPIFVATFFAFAFAALAQDKTRPPIAEAKVAVAGGRVILEADGKCYLTPELTAAAASALAADAVLVATTKRAVAKGVCDTVQAAALLAAKLDLGVGSGAKP